MTHASIAIVCGIPMAVGVAIWAVLRFFTDDGMLASAIAAGAILLAMFVMFAQEYVALARMHEACVAARQYCPAFPGDFNRYRIIGIGAFVDIGLLFAMSLAHDEWRRRRNWRSA